MKTTPVLADGVDLAAMFISVANGKATGSQASGKGNSSNDSKKSSKSKSSGLATPASNRSSNDNVIVDGYSERQLAIMKTLIECQPVMMVGTVGSLLFGPCAAVTGKAQDENACASV